MGRRVCPVVVVDLRGRRWVCIRPAHDAGHADVDDYRRRQGIAVRADKHVFVRDSGD